MDTHSTSPVLVYAGVGSRETPGDILVLMRRLAEDLARLGYLLRSGAAEKADEAFEEGCDAAGGAKEVFLPWKGFRERYVGPGVFLVPADVYPSAEAIAAEAHPRWQWLKRGAKALHTRNVCQVLGPRLDAPVLFVVCWTKGGLGGGGTGQAIRIAKSRGIPVIDLGDPETLDKVLTGEWGPWLRPA